MPQYLKGKGGEEMLRKLMRVVLTIVGAIVGYGVFYWRDFYCLFPVTSSG